MSLPTSSPSEKPTIMVSNSMPPSATMIAAAIANGRTSGDSRMSVKLLIWHSLLRLDLLQPCSDFPLAVQPVEFIELLVAEHAGSGHAGYPCDRRHGPIGSRGLRRRR